MAPLLRLQLIFDVQVLNALKQALVDSPKQFYAVVNQHILPVAQARLDDILNRDPGPVAIPFQFATPKSRRYYFANFQVPYKRTGNVRKWRIILKAFTGQVVELVFQNDAPYAQYVFGDAQGAHQVPGHARTGWINAAGVLVQQTEMVLNDLSEAWIEEMLPEAA